MELKEDSQVMNENVELDLVIDAVVETETSEAEPAGNCCCCCCVTINLN